MKKLIIVLSALAVTAALAGCQNTDVIGKVSITSFDAILNQAPDQVAFDEMNNGFALKSPGGERLVWGKDFSTEGKPDLMMELDATPFLNAGLQPEKLDKEMYLYDSASKILMIHSEIGPKAFSYSGEATAIDAYKQLVKNYRETVGYHEKLDHYGVKFGNGNMFEWAKDMATNDKDIVFVLNPQAFIDAGVDPAKVTGWVFAQVEVKDDAGKDVLVDKFLKPYNLD